MIYHYTTLETLALILDSGKIRFNNLNDVDDILEGSLFEKAGMAQHVFVSCWTKDEPENVALWKMYTHGKGVRIGLPDYPWVKNEFDFEGAKAMGFDLIRDPSISYHTPFNLNDVFGDRHFIYPPFSFPMPTNKFFGKQVEYYEEDKLKRRYKEMYTEQINSNDGTWEMNFALEEYGKYKHKRWEFQNEYRFVLFISPLDQKINLKNNGAQLIANNLRSYVKGGRQSSIKDFFVSLSAEAIKEMEVTMGPLTTKADEIIVKSILEKYKVPTSVKMSLCQIRK